MIYMDNAATTMPKKEVVEAMMPYLTENYGNPSAIYQFANISKAAIAKARKEVADLIHVRPETIYFTSGGTESDNWVLQEAFHNAIRNGIKEPHIITSRIEHHAILHTCQSLRELGCQVTMLPVDHNGLVDPRAVRDAIQENTVLISIMAANNEIGTIEPITEIGEIAHGAGIPFHTDAVQAFGQIPMDVSKMPIDYLSASSHKIYGPKGVGFLYINEKQKTKALLHGGGQERNRRAGTENVAGIVGFGKACELAKNSLEDRMQRESNLRDYMTNRLLKEISDVHLNGDPIKRLPNNINLSFQGIEGESILIMLDMRGICASSGSACTAGSIDPSHVLIATGLSPEEARESIRLTISDTTTKDEVDQVVDALIEITGRLREMSPLYS
ncbi:MAG: cysteine desulfurase NifS [Lachnospiraceae bacterium]|nr:cysteine desulfurase NifS [Lachnospiraceae bacterium]